MGRFIESPGGGTGTSTGAKIRRALGLAVAAPTSDVVATITELQEHNAAAVAQQAELIEKALDAGVEAGRILRVHRYPGGWAHTYATKDPAGFLAFLREAPVVGFATATDEFQALVKQRTDESRRPLEFTAALERVVRLRPQVADEVRGQLVEFSAGAAVNDEEVMREVARRHPALVVRARELVAASGKPLEVAEAQRLVAQEHPELYQEVRLERPGAGARSTTHGAELEQFRAKVTEKVNAGATVENAQVEVAAEEPELYAAMRSSPRRREMGPATREFRRAVEDITWADGVSWDEAARRVFAAHPGLSARLARERAGAV